MSEIQDEAYAKACQEIEKLQLENAKLQEEWLELSDEMLSFTGLDICIGLMSRLSSSNPCWSALPMRWRRVRPTRILN
jgi:hypothetical protein